MVEISLIRFFSQLDDLFYLVCWNKTPISTAIIDLCVWLDLMTPVSTAILDLCMAGFDTSLGVKGNSFMVSPEVHVS